MEEMSTGGCLNCREVRTQRGFSLKASIQKQGKKKADFVDQETVELSVLPRSAVIGWRVQKCLFGESACKFVAAREPEVSKTSESC